MKTVPLDMHGTPEKEVGEVGEGPMDSHDGSL
jgi:hypothetical protein